MLMVTGNLPYKILYLPSYLGIDDFQNNYLVLPSEVSSEVSTHSGDF